MHLSPSPMQQWSNIVGKIPHATLGHEMHKCRFKCDYIADGASCHHQCNHQKDVPHSECKCEQHVHASEYVMHLRMGLAKMKGRRKCRNSTCSYVVGGSDDHEHYCCGCCQAADEGTASATWKAHGKFCSSVYHDKPLKRCFRSLSEENDESQGKATRIFYDPRAAPTSASVDYWADRLSRARAEGKLKPKDNIAWHKAMWMSQAEEAFEALAGDVSEGNPPCTLENCVAVSCQSRLALALSTNVEEVD